MNKLGYFALGLGLAVATSAVALQGVDLQSTNTGLVGVLSVPNGGTGVGGGSAQWNGTVTTVNFGSAGDNAIAVPLPSGFTQFLNGQISITGCSGSITGATFGVFTATGGGGSVLIASGTAPTVTNGTTNTANNAQISNLSSNTITAYTPVSGSIQFRVGTTVAQTCKVHLGYRPVP